MYPLLALNPIVLFEPSGVLFCCLKYLLTAKLGRKFKLDYYCCGKCGIIMEFLLPNRKSFFGVFFLLLLHLSRCAKVIVSIMDSFDTCFTYDL